MARIREYQLTTAAQGSVGGRNATSSDMGGAIGEAGQQLSSTINQTSNILADIEAKNEVSTASAQLAAYQEKWGQTLVERSEAAQPGEKITPQIREEMAAGLQEFSGNFRTRQAQDYVKAHGIEMQHSFTMKALQMDMQSARAKGLNDYQNLKDSTERQIFAGTVSYDEAKAKFNFDYKNATGAFASLGNQAARDKVYYDTIKGFAWTGGQNAINNPAARATFMSASQRLMGNASNIAEAIFAQESSSGKADTSKPNYAGATGPMQITKPTWDTFVNRGIIPKDFDINDPDQNKKGGESIVNFYAQKYNGDNAKIAAAYYGGEGAVNADGSINRDWRDKKNPNAPTVGQYVDTVVSRLKPEAGIDTSKPIDIPNAPKFYQDMTVEQQVQFLHEVRAAKNRDDVMADKTSSLKMRDDIAYMSATGNLPTNPLKETEVSDPLKWEAYQATIEAVSATRSVMNAPKMEQQAFIENMRPTEADLATPGLYAKKQQSFDNAIKAVQSANTKREEDPVGVANARGAFKVTPLSDGDLKSADNFAAFIKGRIPATDSIATAYETQPRLLTNADAHIARSMLNSMNATDQANYLSSLNKQVPDRFNSLINEISPGDNPLKGAGQIMSSPFANPKVANDTSAYILLGRQAMNMPTVKGADGKVEKQGAAALLPLPKDAIELLAEAYPRVYNSEQLANVSELVMAHYVGVSTKGGVASPMGLSGLDSWVESNKQRFKDSMVAVLGKPTKVGTGYVTRPYGLDQDMFNGMLAYDAGQKNYKQGHFKLYETTTGKYEYVQGDVPTGKFFTPSVDSNLNISTNPAWDAAHPIFSAIFPGKIGDVTYAKAVKNTQAKQSSEPSEPWTNIVAPVANEDIVMMPGMPTATPTPTRKKKS